MPSNADEATIAISRRRGGWRDRARSYVVVVDSKPISKIKHGQRVELPVPPGPHDLFLKISWCTSPIFTFDAQPGAVIGFSCEPGGPATAGLRDVLGNTGRYIALTRIDPHTP